MARIFETLTRFGLTVQVFKTALAAAISWVVSTTILPSPYPYFSPLAALLSVQVTIADSLKAAAQRISGIIGGVIISILVGHWLSIGTSSIFLMTLIGMAIASALNLSSQITAQIGMSSLLVLAIGQGHGLGYAVGRITETIAGSVVAIIVNAVVVPPNAVPPAERRILALSCRAAQALAGLGHLLEAREIKQHSGLEEVTELVKETEKGIKSIRLAEQSLKYSPFPVRTRERLAQLAAGMERLEHITIQIRGIRKGLVDLRMAAGIEFSGKELKAAIEYTAKCISGFGSNIIHPSEENWRHLVNSVEDARFRQSFCLADVSNFDRFTILHLGGILSDLHRIANGVAEEKRF